ncbi:hypothetical protein MKX54_20305 [Alkalihalobacillus sp. FSL R5-0424]
MINILKKKSFISLLVFFTASVLISCSNSNTSSDQESIDEVEVDESEWVEETTQITAEERLTLDSEADILMFNGLIYETGIDWVDNLNLNTGEKVGEIEETADEGNYNFQNGMASQLPVGAIIYSAEEREDVLIIDNDGEISYYYELVEG